jgi:uncharacterized protein
MTKRERKYYELEQKMRRYAARIFDSGRFDEMDNNIQHGKTTTKQHAMNVAHLSVKLGDALRIHYSKGELIRGALLHDYFLYDWHERANAENGRPRTFHGFLHPGIALKNAEEDYNLSRREREIIRKHMWPLTLTRVPRCREAWLVVAADKAAAISEFFVDKFSREK